MRRSPATRTAGRRRRCDRTGQQFRPARRREVDRRAHFWVRIRRGPHRVWK
jgi:hypothetical protein